MIQQQQMHSDNRKGGALLRMRYIIMSPKSYRRTRYQCKVDYRGAARPRVDNESDAAKQEDIGLWERIFSNVGISLIVIGQWQ